ncbi:hypothetical protein EV182_001762, partial [Spiromyces aspiralis]
YGDFLDVELNERRLKQACLRALEGNHPRTTPAPHVGDSDSAADPAVEENKGDEESVDVAQMVTILNKRIDALNDLMNKQVLEQHGVLLRQVTGLRRLDGGLQALERQVARLRASMETLQSKLRIPYEQIVMYDMQIRNLRAATGLVRAVAKFLQLLRRLNTQIPDSPPERSASAARSSETRPNSANSDCQARRKRTHIDYTLAALTLHDLDALLRTHDLRGIKIVEPTLDVIASKRRMAEEEAHRLLAYGMSRDNQTEVANALQIFFNLDMMTEVVTTHIKSRIHQQEKIIHQQLDPKGIQEFVQQHNARATKVDGSDRTGVTAVFWERLGTVLNSVLDFGMEIDILERVLRRKRTVVSAGTNAATPVPATFIPSLGGKEGTVFLDFIIKALGQTPMMLYWTQVTICLGQELGSASEGSNIIRRILKSQYPRLVMLLQAKLASLIKHSAVAMAGAPGGSKYIRSVLESAYKPRISVPSSSDYDTAKAQSHLAARAGVMRSIISNPMYNSPLFELLHENVLAQLESDYTEDIIQRLLDSTRRCFISQSLPQPTTRQARKSDHGSHPQSSSSASGRGRGEDADGSRENVEAAIEASTVIPQKKHTLSLLRAITAEIEMVKSDDRLLAHISEAAIVPSLREFLAATNKSIDRITSAFPNILEPPLRKSDLEGYPSAALSLLVKLHNVLMWLGDGLIQIEARTWTGAGSHASQRLTAAHRAKRQGQIAALASESSPVRTVIHDISEALGVFIGSVVRNARCAISKALQLVNVDSGTLEGQRNMQPHSPSAQPDYLEAIDLITIRWLQQQVLSTLECDLTDAICSLIVGMFQEYVFRVCLLAPLTEPVKLKLTDQVSKLEFVCNQLVSGLPIHLPPRSELVVLDSNSAQHAADSRQRLRLTDCGNDYAAFRALRPLLFTENCDIVVQYRPRETGGHSGRGSLDAIDTWDLLDHLWSRVDTEIYLLHQQPNETVNRSGTLAKTSPRVKAKSPPAQWHSSVTMNAGDINGNARGDNKTESGDFTQLWRPHAKRGWNVDQFWEWSFAHRRYGDKRGGMDGQESKADRDEDEEMFKLYKECLEEAQSKLERLEFKGEVAGHLDQVKLLVMEVIPSVMAITRPL